MMTPFSGISLIIHSIIIWSSKLFTYFRGGRHFEATSGQGQTNGRPSMIRAWLDVLLSLFFINVILAFILVSFFFALKSGIEDSMSQPHVRYIQGKYEELRAAYPELAYQDYLKNTFHYEK